MCLNAIQIGSNDTGNYQWNTGESSQNIKVKKTGLYWVKTERNNCFSIDTIHVKQDLPLFDLGEDQSICEGTVLIGADINGKYLWNTGDTGRKIEGYEGKYKLSIDRNHCKITDSINIIRIEKPKVDLGPDRGLCLNQLVLSTQIKGSYLWNTGEKTPGITIHQTGTYSLMVSNGYCNNSDTINIFECKRLIFYLPNSFSPNNDGINDVFKPEGEGIKTIQMQIFNRWGEELLNVNDPNAAWDGTHQNNHCEQGVYLYKLVIEGNRPEDIRYVFGTVTLLK